MKRLSVEVLVLLALGMAVSSAPPDPRIAELESRLKTTQGKERALILADLAGRYYRIDPDKTLAYAHEALALGKALKDPQSHAEALQILGMDKFRADSRVNMAACHKSLGEYEQALDLLFKALSTYESATYAPGIAGACVNAGEIYLGMKKPDQALPYLEKAIRLAEEIRSLDGARSGYEKLAKYHLRELLRFQGKERQRDDIVLMGIRPISGGVA